MDKHTIVVTGWILWTALAAPLAAGAPREGAPREADEALAVERLARRVAELEAENADLKSRMERSRASFARAVAQLQQLRGRPAPPAASGPGRRSAVEVGDRLLSRPRTRLEGRRVTVAGEIFNPHREALFGTLVIELFRDGMPVDEARLPFEVPPQTRSPYAQTFELGGWAAGAYSARAGLAY
jgi:hypothetical protein